MAKNLRLLDQVHIASPCPANWDAMRGDDRARHCSECRLNVYNLSDMGSEEAETFLRGVTGRVCVRYYQRADGKVMTKDCPRGVRALKQKALTQLAIAASLTLTAIGCGSTGERVKRAFGLDKFERPTAIAGGMAFCPPPASTSHVSGIVAEASAPVNQVESKR